MVALRCCRYFFPKNDIIFPCPGFAMDFFAFAVAGAGVAICFFAGSCSSSSENDSHAASCMVTEHEKY